MRLGTCLLVAAHASLALGGDVFHPEGSYDSRVPHPSSVLGFELGSRPARPDAIVRYMERVEETSRHARLVRYARSHEGRDLVYLVVTSEGNLARLDEIQAAIQTLADPREKLGDGELERLLEKTPAVAYMAYAIHGDELSSADAALRLAYELGAGRDDETALLRERLVILIDPIENPDGRQRILAMTASYQGDVPNPDPDALAHTAFWPWGRGNHYLFDLNRDWFAAWSIPRAVGALR